MIGFKNFDRFDRWVLTFVTIFGAITVWVATHAPASMSVTTMLLSALVSCMFASGRLIWRVLPKPPSMNFFPPAEPLRVLTSMSTMSKGKFDNLTKGRTKTDALNMLKQQYWDEVYGRSTLHNVTHFTVDCRDRAHDPICGKQYSPTGISPAMPVPHREPGMVNIFWYENSPERVNGITGKPCHHSDLADCVACGCHTKAEEIAPAPPPPLLKAKHISRGGLGASAIHHGISKRAKLLIGIDPAGPPGSGVVVAFHRGRAKADKYENSYNFHGFSHTLETIDGHFVSSTTDVLEMGYNKEPSEWTKPGAVIMDRDGKVTHVEWGKVLTQRQKEALLAKPKTVEDVIDGMIEKNVFGMWLSDLKEAAISSGITRSDFWGWARANRGYETLIHQTVNGPKKIWINF